jgi:RND family efflux transporter MFP subunit
VYYESFQVSVGDQVKAGDVLATLESAEIDEEIKSCEAEMSALSLERDRNSALLSLYDERLADRETLTGASAKADARRRAYEVAIRDAEDRMEVLSVRLDELNAQRAGRVVTSDIDGTVTYVLGVQPGETSVKGRTVVTVTDLSSCAFESTVEHPEAISFDETYEIAIDGQDYAIRRTTAEALGVEDPPMNEKSDRTRVYFAPLVPSVNLAEGATGKFTVVVESSEDALYVPASCVWAADGQACVYVLDEAGLKQIRPVTVGLATQRSCEILTGLSEGDRVVAD